ncbi:MAG: haloacid dehalogenase-like hydrolase, partial [Bdellovibrionales bacterium]|nr:haloacid dehalogenase-like hydrolase [Bdellovibrionales bacterium]
MLCNYRILAPVLAFLMLNPAWADDLPSWSDSSTKKHLQEFVQKIEQQQVPLNERIAVFDNDGTLWTERPFPIQGYFAFDRVKALAPDHPEWKDQMPFKVILEDNQEEMKKLSSKDLAQIIAVTHSGMTVEEFNAIVKKWAKTFKHPALHKSLENCVYKPMVEVLTFLRKHGFKTYIVSGGGIDFMRALVEEFYGIPPCAVIGSSGKTQFQIREGKAELVKLPEISSIDDKEGKPININLHIGRRPLLAFGNSDGDLQMLQYTDIKPNTALMLLLHHDDAEREFAYDREPGIGQLD